MPSCLLRKPMTASPFPNIAKHTFPYISFENKSTLFGVETCFGLTLQDIEEISELHMVTPDRRREPRSGKRRSGKCKPLPVKSNKERKAEKPRLAFSSSSSSVFSVTSDVSYYNEGPISSSKTKDGDVRNKDDQTVIIQDSLPLADSLKVCRRSSIKYLFLFHKIQF